MKNLFFVWIVNDIVGPSWRYVGVKTKEQILAQMDVEMQEIDQSRTRAGGRPGYVNIYVIPVI